MPKVSDTFRIINLDMPKGGSIGSGSGSESGDESSSSSSSSSGSGSSGSSNGPERVQIGQSSTS